MVVEASQPGSTSKHNNMNNREYEALLETVLSNKSCSSGSGGRKTYSVLQTSNSISLWALIKSSGKHMSPASPGERPDHFPTTALKKKWHIQK